MAHTKKKGSFDVALPCKESVAGMEMVPETQPVPALAAPCIGGVQG